jgi:hypothetical protein
VKLVQGAIVSHPMPPGLDAILIGGSGASETWAIRKRAEPSLREALVEIQSDLAAKLAALGSEWQAEAAGYMGDPPDPARIPASFWESVEKAYREQLAAGLILAYVLFYRATSEAAEVTPDDTVAFQRAERAAQSRLDEMAPRFVEHSREQVTAIWQRPRDVAAEHEQRIADAESLAEREAIQEEARQAVDLAREEAAEKMGDVFGEERAERIGQTETRAGAVQGTHDGGEDAAEELGAAMAMYWRHGGFRPEGHAGAAEHPCPICTPREGMNVEELGELPPAHPDCDCFVGLELAWSDGTRKPISVM